MMKKTLRTIALGLGLAAATGALAEVTLYESEDFRGRSFTVTGPVPNFARYGFNDHASSVAVRRGNYLVCDAPGFAGQCVVLAPGDYASLRAVGLNNRISSARPAGPRDRAGPPPAPRGPRAVLFGRPNFEGRGFALEGNQIVRDLRGSGFDDRASSLRVERGYWIFCSEPDFHGICRTFGPGDYLQLPPGLENNISSARLIHARYPYRDRPTWR
jgi:hypothetical protein